MGVGAAVTTHDKSGDSQVEVVPIKLFKKAPVVAVFHGSTQDKPPAISTPLARICETSRSHRKQVGALPDSAIVATKRGTNERHRK